MTMTFNLIYLDPYEWFILSVGFKFKKMWKLWKKWADWGNTEWADAAGLLSIGLNISQIKNSLINIFIYSS